MMEAKELRIGNWILPEHDLDGKYHVVKDLSKNVVNSHIESWYSPIPLTHEILEGCGFEKEESSYSFCYKKEVFGKSDFVLFFSKREGFAFEWGDPEENGFTNIKYVHKLQNVFFDIMDEELTVKLPVTA